MSYRARIAVVGGGIAGLATSLQLARAGCDVTLYERSAAVGGRAVTTQNNGFHFNLGPHAVYPRSQKMLRDLGVELRGGNPDLKNGAYLFDGREFHRLPSTASSLLGSSALSMGDKFEASLKLNGILNDDGDGLERLTVEQWVSNRLHSQQLRRFLHTLIRIASYTHAPDRLSAQVGAQQIRQTDVLYLDGGWQTIVDSLRALVEDAGVMINTEQRVEAIETREDTYSLRLAGGEEAVVSAVVLAVAPPEVSRLLAEDRFGSVREKLAAAVPVQAAILDVAVSRRPARSVVLPLDRPLYYSVHSSVARLAPEGSAILSAAKYLTPGAPSDAESDRKQLEDWLTLIEPAWRNVAVEQRFMPNLTVYNWLPSVAQGGLAGRPAVQAAPGVYLAGDWVGPEGMLTDAVLASSLKAAKLAAAHASRASQPEAAALA
ncbi:MAG: FAD-dependent oxidoreductase [Dehalococcoidia bacterium]